MNDTVSVQRFKRGSRGCRSGLGVKPDLAELLDCRDDAIFGDGDGSASGLPYRSEHFAHPDRTLDRGAFRDCRFHIDGYAIVCAGLEACVNGRTIFRLRSEQAGQFSDVPCGEKFHKANVASQDVAAGTRWNDDVVRRLEAKVFPEL